MAKITTHNVYDAHVNHLQKLLSAAKKQKDPAYWLHRQKARRSLFMLESLTLVVAKATNNETSKKWNKLFKKLEDAMGQIDHYDSLVQQFSPNPSIKKEQVDYYREKLDKSLKRFNKKLIKKDFYNIHLSEFSNENKLTPSKPLLSKLQKQINSDTQAGAIFFREHTTGFTDFEKQVHELRRKIRWTSIYGESFGGWIVLNDPGKTYRWEKQFITRDILQSEFSRLPIKKGLRYYMNYNKKVFYATSHVIDRLGKIKDKGLTIEALAKALHKTGAAPPETARTHAAKLLKIRESEAELLKQAHTLLTKYYSTYKIHLELFKA